MQTRFAEIFEALKQIYSVYEHACVVACDEAGRYSLATHEVRTKDGGRTAFGGVEIRKRYVSAHLMPVYAHPELFEDVPDVLIKRMHGKSCFNFTTLDRPLLDAFSTLVARGFARFDDDGRFRPRSRAPTLS